jgi:hypothetical protein
VIVSDRLSVSRETLFDMDDTDRRDLADPRLRVASAAVYVAGLTLMITGSVGAFLWTPVLWCAVVGLVVIAAAFAVTGGRL